MSPARFARRTHEGQDHELATILAGVPPGVLSLTGGFPNAKTFPTEVIGALTARLMQDPSAFQYTPVMGLPSVRGYLADRQEQLHGTRPSDDELMVTSGGMECIALMCSALLEPGDTVAVEAPTYLGALLAFARAQVGVEAIPMDQDGLVIEALAERLDAGLRPKFLYVIPDFQNPTGRTLPLERREALVELCRRHSVLIFEDLAYRELAFDGEPLPSLWSLAPDVVLQAGTFSKVFFPGVRLGWAAGPAEVVAELAAAKQNTDQCSGGLGQRLLEEYGRAGYFERFLPAARALYRSHWEALDRGLRRSMPEGCTWTTPTGGFLTWVQLPEGVDSVELRPRAIEAGVAYVPGRPFYAGGEGARELRLSFSALDETQLETAAERLAEVIAA